MKKKRQRSRGHAVCMKPYLSRCPKQGSTICLLYLDGFSTTSGIVQLSKTIDARSVQFMLPSEPECCLNKGQWLGQFNTSSQSSSVFNICWLTVASTAVVLCGSDTSGAKSKVFTVVTEERVRW